MQEKKALTREISKRHQKAQKKEKTGILNEPVKTTGCNRKYILHVLANWGKTSVIHMTGKLSDLRPHPTRGVKEDAGNRNIRMIL